MGPLGFFSQKNLKTIILSKNVLRNFKPLCCWHFLQKSEKLHPLTFHNTSKPHLGQLCPLSHRKPQNKTFPGKNNLGQLIRLSFAVIHAKKKNRNIPCVNFSCNLKKLILGPIWWFLAQNPQNKMFFKKNWAQSLFTFDNLNSHKNSENSYEWIYIWRVFQRTFTLWV